MWMGYVVCTVQCFVHKIYIPMTGLAVAPRFVIHSIFYCCKDTLDLSADQIMEIVFTRILQIRYTCYMREKWFKIPIDTLCIHYHLMPELGGSLDGILYIDSSSKAVKSMDAFPSGLSKAKP